MTERQLLFDLGHRTALGREDFLVAPSNELAVAWVDRWPDWPGPALALHGPAGCGKSHLGEVWRAASKAVRIDAAHLTGGSPPAVLGGASAAVVEGAETALATSDGLAPQLLLHLYNMLAERGGHLLLTGRRPPVRWACRLADLRSRLAAAQAVAMGAPDDALLEAVLVKQFADRQLKVPPEVVAYLLARMERSFDGLRSLVARLDRAALEARRTITVPFVRDFLAGGAEGAPLADDNPKHEQGG